MKTVVTTDKLNRSVYRGDIVIGPDGLAYQVIRTKTNTYSVWDMARTPIGGVFDSTWFTKHNFRKVLESEKR